jgi:hypothetical protein
MFDNLYPSLKNIHSIHPYPHKFVPQIVSKLICNYSQVGDTILDPFCGSGTTLIEANLSHRFSLGIDFHPLACLISTVKTTPINHALELELSARTQEMIKKVQFELTRKDRLIDFSDNHPSIPIFPKPGRWFQGHIMKELAVLKDAINDVKNVVFKNIYILIFSSIIKDVSNASSLHRLTFKKKRYFPHGQVIYLFKTKLKSTVNHLLVNHQQTGEKSYSRIICHDARINFPYSQVDCIITNLPSFNFEFSRSFKIHYWWLHDFWQYTQKDVVKYLKLLDSERIGTSKLRQPDTKNALEQYFSDLNLVFINLYQILKPGKFCCLQMSDFVLDGEKVQVTQKVMLLMQQARFILHERIRRVIPKRIFLFSKEDKVEEILIFKN